MRILIAEDDFISRNVLEKMLNTLGYDVLIAENGLEAWEIFQKNEIGMVVTDWMMPGMDGLSLCKKIRSSGKDHYAYIIILTAKDQKQDLIETYRGGADDYITKPLDPDELHPRVKTGERIYLLEQKHRRLQNTLIESRDKLRIVFDSLREEIVSVDRDFRIISVNNAFLGARDIAYKEVIGQPCFEEKGLSSLCYEERSESYVEKAFSSGRAQFFLDETTDERGDKRYVETNCLPIKNESGESFQVVIVSRDITDEKAQSEKIKTLNKNLSKAFNQIQIKNETLKDTLEKLKESQDQVLHSEKMASIGQLAAGVAHEINNPTGFVNSNLRSLYDYQNDLGGLISEYRKLVSDLMEKLNQEDTNPDLLKQVQRIREREEGIDIEFLLEDIPNLIRESGEGTERIKKIVMDLKDFAHPGEDKLKETDINKSLDSTLNVVWNELKYKAEVFKDYGDLPPVQCYPQQLNQVFVNILVNAAQAIQENGEIRITTHAANGRVKISISDTGKGIPKENISKIFDPFFTTKDVGKGTGLGLNVSYNIVKKHKGTIDVESEVGKGTTFTIRIPIES